MKSVKAFLDTLAGEGAGKYLLVSLWDSCAMRLVAPADVKTFLDHCAARWQGLPSRGASDAFEYVAELPLGGRHRFLRLCRQTGDLAGRRLSNVTTYSTFVGHHVRKGPPSPSVRIPPAMPPASASGQLRLKRDIDRLTRSPGWMNPAATLGRPHPHPSNCWISVDDFRDSRPLPKYHVQATEADHARDALGLIDHPGAGVHLVRYEFDAAPAATLPGMEMARPTFADRGNRRFRVKSTCQRGQAMSIAGWGATVHLRRLADKTLHPVTGHPERVTTALPISALRGMRVAYLAGTTAVAATTTADEEAFLKLVLGRRTWPGLVRRVCRFVAVA